MAKGIKTGGRQKGTPNKTTVILKDAILKAADNAGGKGGIIGYLEVQAVANPSSFMSLLGRVLPTQIGNEDDKPFKTEETGKGIAQLVAKIEAIEERSAETS